MYNVYTHPSIYLYSVYSIYLSFCRLFILLQGAPFSQICKMTDVFEGSIIRCIRRLEEVLRQMCQAAKTIGNTELENKFAGGTLPPQIPSTSNPFNLQLPSFFLSIQPFIHPSIVYPFICPFSHSFSHSSNYPFSNPSNLPSIHSSNVYPFSHPSNHPFIHPSIHPSNIHSSIFYPFSNYHLSIPSLSYRYSKN